MGAYAEVPVNKGKAQAIIDGRLLIPASGDVTNPMEKFGNKVKWEIAPKYEAEIVRRPANWESIPDGKALIVVVDNGLFEAAGFAYSRSEFNEFVRHDGRARTYLLVDRDVVERATGYKMEGNSA